MTDEALFGGCEACVSRRDFLGRVALVAGAMILAGCSASDLTGIGSNPLPGGPITVKLSDYAGLATVGQPVEIRTSSGSPSDVAAVRTGTSSFVVLYMACTHAGTKVNIQGQIFSCPNHGARFSSTGAVTNGPATRSLAQLTVVYDATLGTITVS